MWRYVKILILTTSTLHITGHAFVLVFNISSKQSLTELKPIVELINEVRNTRNVADIQWWYNDETDYSNYATDQGQQGGLPDRAGG